MEGRRERGKDNGGAGRGSLRIIVLATIVDVVAPLSLAVVAGVEREIEPLCTTHSPC